MALDSLAKWCKCNGMIINTTKTKVMLITTHQKRATLTTEELSLTLNNVDLNMISNDKIFGVVIDNNLTWTHHVDKICKEKMHHIYGQELKPICPETTEFNSVKHIYSHT